MMQRETGPIRRYWNYFKRGKSEINFLLNIYQTIIIIWAGSQIGGGLALLVGFSIVFGFVLFVVSIVIGRYSLTKVDTSLPYINPFSQDVTRYRSLMARGQRHLANENFVLAGMQFDEAERVLIRWLNND